MSKTINLKKRSLIGKREAIVMALAVALTTAGIKAADTLMADDPSGAGGPCPENMVLVAYSGGNFCIDAYEASAGKGCPVSSPGNQNESRDNLDYAECRAESHSGALPWRFLSQNQAAQACAKAGKRLPTNAEWLAAAMGTPDKQSGWNADDCNVSGNWSGQPGLSGSGKDCRSAAGAYDMIGNVWEWVEGTVSEGQYKGRELPESGYVAGADEEALPSATSAEEDPNYYNDYFWLKRKGVRGMARGGYWDNRKEAGQYSLYVVSEPSFSGTGVGFRCVK